MSLTLPSRRSRLYTPGPLPTTSPVSCGLSRISHVTTGTVERVLGTQFAPLIKRVTYQTPTLWSDFIHTPYVHHQSLQMTRRGIEDMSL